MRRLVVSGERLTDRRSRYFMDQQVGLHGMIVSLALGVAGLAAASLFEVRPADRPYHALLWLLWLTSLVAVGTVYSGMTVSVYALPSTIPSAVDMFMPFGIGLMEFMLFAVLTSPLNSQLSPRAVIAVWLSCFCIFSSFASTVIVHVRWLFEHTIYEPPAIRVAVFDVHSLMRRDLAGASGSAAVSGVTAILIGLVHAISLAPVYVVAALLIMGMAGGIVNQREQARILDASLSRLSPAADSTQNEPAAEAEAG